LLLNNWHKDDLKTREWELGTHGAIPRKFSAALFTCSTCKWVSGSVRVLPSGGQFLQCAVPPVPSRTKGGAWGLGNRVYGWPTIKSAQMALWPSLVSQTLPHVLQETTLQSLVTSHSRMGKQGWMKHLQFFV
jgi:hypothetical protein